MSNVNENAIEVISDFVQLVANQGPCGPKENRNLAIDWAKTLLRSLDRAGFVLVDAGSVTPHNKTFGNYTTADLTVKVEDLDTDVRIELPTGPKLTLQYREEGPSLDILFDQPLEVHNWIGSDMKPAPRSGKEQHVRNVDQLMIPLVRKEEGTT